MLVESIFNVKLCSNIQFQFSNICSFLNSFYLTQFGLFQCYLDPNQSSLKWIWERKSQLVRMQEWGSKWIWIRIRPNVVYRDPDPQRCFHLSIFFQLSFLIFYLSSSLRSLSFLFLSFISVFPYILSFLPLHQFSLFLLFLYIFVPLLYSFPPSFLPHLS